MPKGSPDQEAGEGNARSRRRPKIRSRSDCGSGAAAGAPADAAGPPPEARFSMDASESPGMSGRFDGKSHGCAALLLPLMICSGGAGGVGGCMSVSQFHTPVPGALSVVKTRLKTTGRTGDRPSGTPLPCLADIHPPSGQE